MVNTPKYLVYIIICTIGIFSCNEPDKLAERLWYKNPANTWQEALPIGNGRLGAMVFGDPVAERLQLNEESLWAGKPEDPYVNEMQKHYAVFQQMNLEGKYQEALNYGLEYLTVSPTSIRSYEPLGDLFIEFNHADVENYQRQLGLAEGIVTVTYDIDGKKFKRESFVSVTDDVILYHFTSINGESVDCEISIDRKKDIRTYVTNEKALSIDGQIFDDSLGYDDNPGGSGEGGYHMKFAARIGVQPVSGELTASGKRLILKDTREFSVVVSVATDYNLELMNFDRSIDVAEVAQDRLYKALDKDYRELRSVHVKEHSAVYNRVELKLANIQTDTVPTDRRMASVAAGVEDLYLTQMLFQYGRYLLMGSSGFKAVLPANLQGIWNGLMWAPWESDLHLNINLQMNYWPANVCNLSETVKPLSEFLFHLSKKGKVTANRLIGSDGWVAHHVTNAFGRTTPSGSTKRSQLDNGYCFPLAGAWMSLSLWRHYTFEQDVNYLKNEVYPVIRGAARFILDFLKEDEGLLVTVPSYSPENSYIDPKTGELLRNTKAAAIDIQIIRELFQACLSAEKILGTKELTGPIQEALEKLPQIKIGVDGTIQEWHEDFQDAEPGHRHISHLFALYPGSQITEDTPELFEAAARTIEKRLSEGGGQTGWSRAWVVNFYARLYNGKECRKHINALFKEHVAPNLFDLHPPELFQIDGNLGITAGIAEMLLQSHEQNTIRLLPALPDAWSSGSISGLKARGNIEISMNWKAGKLIKAVLIPKKDGKVRLIYNDQVHQVSLKAGEPYAFELPNE